MIYITQWLCPQRHCSIALSWDSAATSEEEVEKRGEEIYKSGAVNRYCGICNGKLHVEHGETGFKTMKEAMPWLMSVQVGNIQARRILQSKN